MIRLKKKHNRLLKLVVSLLMITALFSSCVNSSNQVIINPNSANNLNNTDPSGNQNIANSGNNANNTSSASSGNTENNSNNTNSASTNSVNPSNPGGSNNSENSAGNSAGNGNSAENTTNNVNNAEPDPVTRTWAEETLASMSLTEKIGQMFIIRPDQLEPSVDTDLQHALNEGVTEFSDEMRSTIKNFPVGGFILFDKNFIDPDQTNGFIADMYELSSTLPFIAIDEEGGKISRLANSRYKGFDVPWVKEMGAIGETEDPKEAEAASDTIGKYLKEYRFNLDFAPIADLDDKESEGVIGERSFGTNPKLVSTMIKAFIDGLHRNDILSCLKHFPGQGSAEVDTHEDYSEILSSWDELLQADLIPFKENKDYADMIMLSHISCPNVTGDDLPTSLSSTLITDKLRNEFKYNGVLITDSFHMGAITNNYESDEAAILAVKAGADIILMPDDLVKAFDGLVAAVDRGEISEERIDESVLRILTLKEKIRQAD